MLELTIADLDDLPHIRQREGLLSPAGTSSRQWAVAHPLWPQPQLAHELEPKKAIFLQPRRLSGKRDCQSSCPLNPLSRSHGLTTHTVSSPSTWGMGDSFQGVHESQEAQGQSFAHGSSIS